MADSENDSMHRTLLRREESYAIHALVYAAENPGSSAAQIARDLQMPPAFLAKVLRRLAQVGYVENRQGRNGGVTLTADPADLTLLDVIKPFPDPSYSTPARPKRAAPHSSARVTAASTCAG